MPTRTPDEIRASIEQNRRELGTSLEKLRVEVVRITDWRAQVRRHRQQLVVGAAVTGFVLGGGIAAIGGLFSGDKRDRGRGKRGPLGLGRGS